MDHQDFREGEIEVIDENGEVLPPGRTNEEEALLAGVSPETKVPSSFARASEDRSAQGAT